MTNSLTNQFKQGVETLSNRQLGLYLLFGTIANGFVFIGFPKVGGFLAAMVLATYLAALSTDEGDRE